MVYSKCEEQSAKSKKTPAQSQKKKPATRNATKQKTNILKAMTTQAKMEFLNSSARNSSENPNSFWKLIKQLKQNNTGTSQLFNPLEDRPTTDPKRRARLFNDFFQSFFKPSSNSPPITTLCETFWQRFWSRRAGQRSLLTYQGRTNQQGQMVSLPSCLNVMLRNLPDFWNTSSTNRCPRGKSGETGPRPWSYTYPQEWTHREDVRNYRPISLTSLACNLLEHILVSGMMYFLTIEGLLSG